MEPPDFDATLAFLKALANQQRLRIVGLLMDQRRSVQELAALIGLKEPTICHHLAVLNRVGLLEMTAEGNIHWYRLRADRILALGRSAFGQERMNIDPGDRRTALGQAHPRELHRGRTAEADSRQPQETLGVVLRWLTEKFRMGEDYTEASVNKIIQKHHWDSATLRRELIGYRMLKRQKGMVPAPAGERLAAGVKSNSLPLSGSIGNIMLQMCHNNAANIGVRRRGGTFVRSGPLLRSHLAYGLSLSSPER